MVFFCMLAFLPEWTKQATGYIIYINNILYVIVTLSLYLTWLPSTMKIQTFIFYSHIGSYTFSPRAFFVKYFLINGNLLFSSIWTREEIICSSNIFKPKEHFESQKTYNKKALLR